MADSSPLLLRVAYGTGASYNTLTKENGVLYITTDTHNLYTKFGTDAAFQINAATATQVANSLTFGSKVYNGSVAQTITLTDLDGLSSTKDVTALNFANDKLTLTKGTGSQTTTITSNTFKPSTAGTADTALSANRVIGTLYWGSKNYTGASAQTITLSDLDGLKSNRDLSSVTFSNDIITIKRADNTTITTGTIKPTTAATADIAKKVTGTLYWGSKSYTGASSATITLSDLGGLASSEKITAISFANDKITLTKNGANSLSTGTIKPTTAATADIAKKVQADLKFGTQTYNGSVTKTITLSDFLTGGKIPLDYIPQGALERFITVADTDALNALRADDVQLGDVVKVTADKKLYYITSATDSTITYEEFVAGTAAVAETANALTNTLYFRVNGENNTVSYKGGTTNNSVYIDNNLVVGSASSSTAHADVTTNGVYLVLTGAEGSSNTKHAWGSVQLIGDTGLSVTSTSGGVITVSANTFIGASASADGVIGFVPAPSAGAQNKFLKGDGSWATPTDSHWTTNAYVTNATNGTSNVATTNPYINICDNSAIRRSIQLKGSGVVSVTSNSSAAITINVPTYAGASSAAAGTIGLVPAASAGQQNLYLKADGSWANPDTHFTTHIYVTAATAGTSNTTATNPYLLLYDNSTRRHGVQFVGTYPISVTASSDAVITVSASTFKAATSSAAGSIGFVPAPAAGAQAKFLRGDGTWQTPTNTTYGAATTAALGLVKIGTNISVNGGLISVATASTSTLGVVKIGSNININSGTISVNDMAGASASADGTKGLVPAPSAGAQDKFLKGDGSWATPTDTNTHYTVALIPTNSATSTTAITTNLNNGSVLLNLIEGESSKSVRSTLRLYGQKGIGVTYTASSQVIYVGHTNAVTAQTSFVGTAAATAITLNANSTFTLPAFKYDAEGHITAHSTTSIKIGSVTASTAFTNSNGAEKVATVLGTDIYSGVTWGTF